MWIFSCGLTQVPPGGSSRCVEKVNGAVCPFSDLLFQALCRLRKASLRAKLGGISWSLQNSEMQEILLNPWALNLIRNLEELKPAYVLLWPSPRLCKIPTIKLWNPYPGEFSVWMNSLKRRIFTQVIIPHSVPAVAVACAHGYKMCLTSGGSWPDFTV